MADPGKTENAIWPMPNFQFRVTWDDTIIKFSQISGLDDEAKIIEYRQENSPVFHPIKMPGIGKVNNVTMKRGVFVGNENFHSWYSKVNFQETREGKSTIVIELLNEVGKSTMTWTLNNAYPTKITSTAMQADANEAAIDTLEIAFETLVIRNENSA